MEAFVLPIRNREAPGEPAGLASLQVAGSSPVSRDEGDPQ